MASESQSPTPPEEDGWIVVPFAKEVYSINAVLKAAYRFTHRAYVKVELNNGQIEAHLRPKTTEESGVTLTRELFNEALDQQLRETLARETQSVRDLILGHALSETNLLDAELTDVDSGADPLGIGRPALSFRDPNSSQHSAPTP
ncbi:MAG TPA: His-Xaa-Ser system protein HxsD [Opitutaceae bacterium]|jgi:His-Xaa-Ser system protein HxsD